MYSFRPCAFLVFCKKAERALVSGASPALTPRKSSAQGLVEAPPGTSHLYGQLRLMSWPRQLLPEVV